MKIHDFLKDPRKADQSLRQRDVRQALRDTEKTSVAVINPCELYVQKAQTALREIAAGRLIDLAAAPITADAVCTATLLAGMGLLFPPLPASCILCRLDSEPAPKLLLVETGPVAEQRQIAVFEVAEMAVNQDELIALQPVDYVVAVYVAGKVIGYPTRGAASCQGTMALAHTALAFLADKRSKVVRWSASEFMAGFWKVDHTASAAHLPHESAEDAAKHMTRGQSFFEAV